MIYVCSGSKYDDDFIIGNAGFFQCYSLAASVHETLMKVENECQNGESDCSGIHEEIERIRREFIEAKVRFKQVPEALKNMARMNPEGMLNCYLNF